MLPFLHCNCNCNCAMRLTRSLLRSSYFFRRRRPRSRASPFFITIGRKRGAAAADNPEPSSPKVTCIGQVRVKSQKKVKQYRRRINGEASFRSAAEPSFQHQQRRSRRDQRWVHLPSCSAVLRDLCCLFRCCTCSCNCSCFERRHTWKGCGSWWCGGGERRREIEAASSGGDEEEVVMSGGNSRRHVFDDIEVNGDRIEVKGRSFFDGEDGFAISIPPKNALLLMRCRSDPIKMAAIANRISSDAARYETVAIEVDDNNDDDQTTSSDEVYEVRVLEQEEKVMLNQDKLSFVCNQDKVEEIKQEFHQEEEEDEEVESNMSSFEALLETENCEDCEIKQVEAKAEENDENGDPTAVEEEDDEKQEKEAAVPAPALPECLLLMMREPKLSMEVSKETWVCATDFIRLHPERPRRAAAKSAEPPVVKRRAAAEKPKPRVPPPPKKNDTQPARSSCSLPAASAAAGSERKRVGACELTRCKSEPMSTAAAKLMPEAGCWKENVEMEPHRQAPIGVGAAGVGF
ncbi:uncharacterized protein LOC131012439 [Salvia miltiorrhiza]|uniref:uncharacterized protein LOC131012439 n=1 Tax=Salvia miltiorrhiza TaxID=226208 RepID=UPI0025ACEED7|nr:uncharacterized protein LOC131012439 [Salvia miltiorrhiza]